VHSHAVVSTKLEGSARGLNSRIIGGSRVNATRYPYFTNLRVFLQSGNIWTCGGSLVHSDVVLTSACCLTYSMDPIVSIKAYVNYTKSIYMEAFRICVKTRGQSIDPT
jgi:secreted trypsin-like serine protease